MKSEATIPGTSWAVDPRTSKILVTADSTVTGDKWDRLESTVESLGSGMATLKKSEGTFRTFVSGGDAIFAAAPAVRSGFNVTAGDGSPAFLTAGHRAAAGDAWSDQQGGEPIATVDQALFPCDGDFALVKYDDPATEAPGEVNVGGQTVPIVQAAEATVGQQVFRMGSTTGLADGQVLGLDARSSSRDSKKAGTPVRSTWPPESARTAAARRTARRPAGPRTRGVRGRAAGPRGSRGPPGPGRPPPARSRPRPAAPRPAPRPPRSAHRRGPAPG
ncbi:hypothetical protein SALBM217S_03182 [Streptomyces griseoloalbus]